MDICVILTLLIFALGAFYLLLREGVLEHPGAILGSAALIAAAVVMRAGWFDWATGDYNSFLKHWVEFFRLNGGFAALSQPVGNYNLPYLYFLALFSYIDIYDLHLIKLLSVFFDLVLSWGAMRIVGVFAQSRVRRLIAFFGVLYLPTVAMNGALWGQCDAIYTAFAVWSVYFALAKRPGASMVCITLSFAFKLQAVFVMPLFAVLLFTNRVKVKHFFLFPATYFIVCLPAVIAGRPLKDALFLYFDQIGSTGTGLNYSSPSMYAWFDGSENVELWSKLGLVIAFAFLFLLLGLLLWKRKRVDDRVILLSAVIMCVGIPFLLPHMHERYFFCADVLSLVLAIVLPEMCLVPALVSFASFLGYYVYLRLAYLLPMHYGAAALVFALILLFTALAWLLFSPAPAQEPTPETAE